MKAKFIIALIFPIIFAFTAEAQFYKYYDDNGNLRYTDDINQIPEDQRQQIKTYESADESGEQADEALNSPSTAGPDMETSSDSDTGAAAD